MTTTAALPAIPTANGMKALKPEEKTSLISHLVELRGRLLRVFIGVGVVFLALFPFANPLYEYLSAPLMQHLPQDGSMIAIEVAAPFLTPFKLTLLIALTVSLPYVFYQVWAFVAPGLYRRERYLVLPLMASSTLLFYAGMAFAYFVAFPLMFAFFNAVAPAGVTVMTDISRYLDFVVKIFIAFGLAFEVPILTVLLVRTGFTTPAQLAAKRPYIIVGAFVVGMVLTPPDVLSQVLLAVPVWLLFETGLVLTRLMKPAGGNADENAGKAPDAP